MGVRDSFQATSTLTKVVFALAVVADICGWISFTTTSWYYEVTPNTNYQYFGLWRVCYGDSLQCGLLDGSANEGFAAVQAFAVFGFMSLNAGLLVLVLFVFWGRCKGNSEARMAAAALFIVSAVTWLISVVVFGAKFYKDVKDLNPFSNTDLGFSFALAVVSLVLALISGILAIFAGSGSVGQN